MNYNKSCSRAPKIREENTVAFDNEKDFYKFFTDSEGGFAMAHWNGDPAIEAKIKQDLNVTIRCLPLTKKPQAGNVYLAANQARNQ